MQVQPADGEAEVWHPDVRFYEIRDGAGEIRGRFYMDLYARANKRGGAWMDDARGRRRRAEGIQTPVAYLNCNFPRPVGGKPALFTHDDVITLFHEFGHGLHHMLTQVDELGVSGINGVEWDAVELPSQFMENFCWEWDVLQHMSQHAETGEPLPRKLYDKMIAAKNFQAGMQTVRQIEFSLFDMRLHGDFDPNGKLTALDLIEQVRDEVAVVRPPKWNRFPHGFTHIFAGGYAAGYYSYKWAEVLSADAYAAFEETADPQGLPSLETGRRYRQHILEVGGSRPAPTRTAAVAPPTPGVTNTGTTAASTAPAPLTFLPRRRRRPARTQLRRRGRAYARSGRGHEGPAGRGRQRPGRRHGRRGHAGGFGPLCRRQGRLAQPGRGL